MCTHLLVHFRLRLCWSLWWSWSWPWTSLWSSSSRNYRWGWREGWGWLRLREMNRGEVCWRRKSRMCPYYPQTSTLSRSPTMRMRIRRRNGDGWMIILPSHQLSTQFTFFTQLSTFVYSLRQLLFLFETQRTELLTIFKIKSLCLPGCCRGYNKLCESATHKTAATIELSILSLQF